MFCPMVVSSADLLGSMYRREPQLGSDGQVHPIDQYTKIVESQGRYMRQLHLSIRPELSVEIGLGYGFSTVFILDAMKTGGYGHQIAIDPLQHQLWNGIGRQRPVLLGMQHRFTFMSEKSVAALPRLSDQGCEAEFIFIDGNHRFDDVLVDFCLADEICPIGGVIIFDDMWMPSIKRVASFARNNRPDYETQSAPVDNVFVVKESDHRRPQLGSIRRFLICWPLIPRHLPRLGAGEGD